MLNFIYLCPVQPKIFFMQYVFSLFDLTLSVECLDPDFGHRFIALQDSLKNLLSALPNRKPQIEEFIFMCLRELCTETKVHLSRLSTNES